MKIELDINAEQIINCVTPDGLIQALREKFKAQNREIQKYKDRCNLVGEWFDGLLDDVRSGEFNDEQPYIKYSDWDFGD